MVACGPFFCRAVVAHLGATLALSAPPTHNCPPPAWPTRARHFLRTAPPPPPLPQHDWSKIEHYLSTLTSLPHVLTPTELSAFVRCFEIVDFLAGVSVCADGEVGRDFNLIAEGDMSMYIEESLFCTKRSGDCMCMSARYLSGAAAAAAASANVNTPDSTLGRQPAGSIDEPPPPPRRTNTSTAAPSKVLAVSTSNTRLIHLSREKWLAFQREHTGDGVCDRILPLLVEPSESLSKLNFFRGIPLRMLTYIGLMFRTVYLRKDEILFEELSSGQSLFIVSSGTARAFVKQSDGTEKQLKQFKTQDILGEIALIMDVPRTATVQATSSCFLLELHRDNFKRFIRMVPSTGNIHAIMKSRTAEHFRKYRVPFFNSIPDDKYIILAELCKIEQIPAGHVVFREGDPASPEDCFYIIAHGEVKVTVRGKGTRRSTAGTLEAPAASNGGAPSEAGVEMTSRQSMATTANPAIAANDDNTERELTRMGPGKYFGEVRDVDKVTRATMSQSTCVLVCALLVSHLALSYLHLLLLLSSRSRSFRIRLARRRSRR